MEGQGTKLSKIRLTTGFSCCQPILLFGLNTFLPELAFLRQ